MSGLLPKFGRISALLATSALLVPAHYTHAATTTKTISTSQTTPVVTNGDDVTISSGGSITVTGGAAVTVNTPNAIDNEGTITGNNGNTMTGILVTTGGVSSILNDGAINITDSTPSTSLLPNGSVTNGAFRSGILLNTATPFIGNITNAATGSISVRGNYSAGIYLENGAVGGGIVDAGTISIAGSYSYGILTEAGSPIVGSAHGVSISNTIDVFGQGTGGVLLNGIVGGQLYIDSTIRSDGYFAAGAVTTTRPTTFTGLTPLNMEQGGPAVAVNASVRGGILLDTAGAIITYGSAPALSVNPSATQFANIHLVAKGTADIELNGLVQANGIYDTISASAVQIGGAGGTALLKDGLANTGKIEAISYDANATGITIGAGANVKSITNSGSILATANFGQGANAAKAGIATGILVTGGALSAITNTGTISASSAGGVTGSAIALDLRGDTTAVTVTQNGSGTTTQSSINGNILFGAQGGTLDLNAGTIAGAVEFGASTANALNVTNGAVLGGAITEDAGGELNLAVTNGRLASTSLTALALSKLTIGPQGQIDFAVDPTTGQSGSVTVAGGVGAIVISTGARIGLTLDAQLTTPETFTVIQTTGGAAGGLVGEPSLVLGDVPYFYDAKIVTDTNGGTVAVDIQDRPFSQAGVLGSESAYEAVFKDNYNDPGIRDAFNAAGTQQGFQRLFQQMLPSYSGGVFEVLAQGADSLARTEAGNPVVESGSRSGGWAHQFGFAAVDSTSSSPGYHGGGLGFAFGWETPASAISTWGFTAAYMRAAADDFNTGPQNQQIGTTYTVGTYWREVDGALRTDASINVGIAELTGERNFAGTDLTGAAVSRTADASWTGGVAQAHLGVSYEVPLGDDYFVRPLVSGDYFMLYQGSYNEHNGGSAFDLAVDSRTDKQGSVTGGVTFGTLFGDRDFTWRPEVMVGYKEIFGGPGQTVAQFAGGSAFYLSPKSQKGGAVGHIGVHGGNKYSDVAIEVGGEDRGDYRAFDGRVVARFKF